MAIIYDGMKCLICGEVIEDFDHIRAFHHFIGNPLDPLFKFSDAAFHEDCYREHPLAEVMDEMEARFDEAFASGPCVVCQEPIYRYEPHFAFGYVTMDTSSPVYRYNFLKFHHEHLCEWEELEAARSAFKRLMYKGIIKREVLNEIIGDLEGACD